MTPERFSKKDRDLLITLNQMVRDGFEGIHKRQDTTNGNVIKNTEFRLRTEATIETMKWILGFVGIGALAAIINFIRNITL